LPSTVLAVIDLSATAATCAGAAVPRSKAAHNVKTGLIVESPRNADPVNMAPVKRRD